VVLAASWCRERQAWQLLAVSAAFAETLLSFSRSAWIGAVLGLAAVFFFRRGRVRPLLAVLVVPAVLFAIGFGQPAMQRTEALCTLEADSLTQRTYLVQTAMQFWRQRPLFGIGPAQFDQLEVDTYGPSFIPEPVHNASFLVLAETGVVGLAGTALAVAGIARRI
jgi:O-antigen ligase